MPEKMRDYIRDKFGRGNQNSHCNNLLMFHYWLIYCALYLMLT